MNIEILISSMNIKDKPSYEDLLNKMNIKKNSLLINQVTDKKIKLLNYTNNSHNKIKSFYEKGLSKSRNKAIENSSGDYLMISDDDMIYQEDFEKNIKKAFDKYSDADIIAFYVESNNINNIKPKLKEGRVGFLKSFKIQSVQICLKKESIIKNNISFDEMFGAGEELYMGEENIFLTDCIKKGLKIYSYPHIIASLEDRESSWFNGYNKKYFEVKAACFYRISPFLSYALCLQFLIRKYKIYKDTIRITDAIKSMKRGIDKYKKGKKW